MARREMTHPHIAIPRRCEVCAFVTEPLTDREWLAKRPSHVLSVQHQDAVMAKSQRHSAAVQKLGLARTNK
jgi:hypothetical protein